MTLPGCLSTQSTNNSRPSSVAVVSQTWSPHTTGDDHDLPWIGVFHFTFCFSDHVVGRLDESERPWPVGPRNCGQFSSADDGSAAAPQNPRVTQRRNGRI